MGSLEWGARCDPDASRLQPINVRCSDDKVSLVEQESRLGKE